MIPGEIITKTVLYGNGDGTWLGHIHIETSQGQTFDVGRDLEGANPYAANVGSGILLGALVIPHQSDDTEDIAKLGFLFLAQPINRISITDATYQSDPTGTNSGINPRTIVVGKWYNHADQDVTYC